MSLDIEPLASELWFERIEMIASGALGSTENGLRHALHLLQLTPRQYRPREYGSIDEAGYEALLEAGELEAAARRLVESPTLTLAVNDASSEGQVAVELTCAAFDCTVEGAGNSLAAAILQAWARCFLTLRSRLGLAEFEAAMTG